MSDMDHLHARTCRWQRTTDAECEYRATHHYCPHPEHACNCNGAEPRKLLTTRERLNQKIAADPDLPSEVGRPDEPRSAAPAEGEEALLGAEDVVARALCDPDVLRRKETLLAHIRSLTQALADTRKEHADFVSGVANAIGLEGEEREEAENWPLQTLIPAVCDLWNRMTDYKATAEDLAANHPAIDRLEVVTQALADAREVLEAAVQAVSDGIGSNDDLDDRVFMDVGWASDAREILARLAPTPPTISNAVPRSRGRCSHGVPLTEHCQDCVGVAAREAGAEDTSPARSSSSPAVVEPRKG